MIRFEYVSFTYPNADRPALDNISLHLLDGEFALVVGPSGSGKSTLLRCVNGLTPHFSGGVISGGVTVNGLDPIEASPKVMSRHVGFVFQTPEAQFVMDRVEDELAFALENAAMPPQEMRIRVEEVLDLLDLAPLRHRQLDTLSGGERQRVAIAAALAFRPQILVLDEPTSQLDPKSAEDVLQALVRLNTDLGLTILLAEHRLERVLPFVDQIIYLPATGSDLVQGSSAQVLPQIDLTPPLVQVAQKLDWSPLPLTLKEGRRHSLRWLDGRTIAPKSHSESPPAGRPYIRSEGVQVAFKGQTVVQGVDLQVWPGEIVALMGRNGAGKTTLLKTLVGLMRPKQGQIVVDDQNVTGRDVADIGRKVGYLPQNPGALLFADTVREELAVTLRNHGLPPQHAPVDPETLLAELGLAGKADDYPRDLSVGEQQRVALAAIMVTCPGALLLDEPTRGLDYRAKQQLIDLLQRRQRAGAAIVLATHDVELAAIAANRVVLMSQGEVIANGSPAEVLGASPLFAPQVARLFPGTGWLTVDDVCESIC
ncbi:MAG: energy-coupling factor ABC transporter ATP-binding protein [Anaerolineae bacterium]|nr:energy-coupling factor ABC transporter ATP-binding protein [Anaerolineae bacterium]MCB9105823.1 energy-coupling factor ABC transporter ATP-binding protein [Anaerolineales bacterium]